MAGRGLSTNAQNIFFWHGFPPSPELWLFLKRFYINKMLLHIFKLNLLNFCQIHEQISLATYNVLTQTCHTLSNTCWVAYCFLCRVSRRWCSPSTFHVMAPVLLSETQENIVCCTIGQDCSTTEHHNYECYALVHVHVFIYEQQLWMFKSEWRMGWMNPNIKPHSMDSWVPALPDQEQTLHDLLL